MHAKYIAVYDCCSTHTRLAEGVSLQALLGTVYETLLKYERAPYDLDLDLLELRGDYKLFYVEIYKVNEITTNAAGIIRPKGYAVFTSPCYIGWTRTVRFSDMTRGMEEGEPYRFITSIQNKMPSYDLNGDPVPTLTNEDYHRILNGEADMDIYYDIHGQPIDIRFYDPRKCLDCAKNQPSCYPTPWLRRHDEDFRFKIYPHSCGETHSPFPIFDTKKRPYKPIPYSLMTPEQRLQFLRINIICGFPDTFIALVIARDLITTKTYFERMGNGEALTTKAIIKMVVNSYTEALQLAMDLERYIGWDYSYKYIMTLRDHSDLFSYLNQEELAEVKKLLSYSPHTECLLAPPISTLYLMTSAMGQPGPTMSQLKDLIVNKLPLTAIAEKADNKQ